MPVQQGKTREERFWGKVAKGESCWLWVGALYPNGYGEFGGGAGNRPEYAHRFSYRLANGPIPEGLVIDHLCRNRACVNPAHLEAVTQRENLLRGAHPKMVAHREGRCLKGHSLTPENVTPHRSCGKVYRKCKRCHREYARLWRARRKEVSDAG